MATSNNDILRRLRFAFDYGDDQMMAVFAHGGAEVNRAQLSDWLKKDDDEAFVRCTDSELARFLNGLIVERRGKREGATPPVESSLSNNLILTKLKIAMAFSGDDVMDVLVSAGHRMSKHELSALFRKPGHKHHRACLDQTLRNFIRGLQMRLRPETVNAPSAS